MDVLTFETCWAVNSEIIKQVTSSWSIFIQYIHSFIYSDIHSFIHSFHESIGVSWRQQVAEQVINNKCTLCNTTTIVHEQYYELSLHIESSSTGWKVCVCVCVCVKVFEGCFKCCLVILEDCRTRRQTVENLFEINYSIILPSKPCYSNRTLSVTIRTQIL